MAFEDYYNINPIAVVDQNTWTDKIPEVIMQFQTGPTIYTPLITWTDRSGATGAEYSEFTELLEGDVDNDEIAYTDQYILNPQTIDSRMHKITTARYGDKVQLHKSAKIFQQWKMSGGRDWQPLLRGVLGSNVRRKLEILARNAYLKGPKAYWTYAGGATSFATLDSTTKFSIEAVNGWNLRLGNTGDPIIPGEVASGKLALIPPGAVYDFQESLAVASTNEASMWRDSLIYGGNKLQYEIGAYKNMRFVEVPNDKYGQNLSVLYNAGAIQAQVGVTTHIDVGDGSPDPATTAVDETWYIGQKDVTHSIEVQNHTNFAVNDIVSIHTLRTSAYGVTNGVNFLSGKTITRRIVAFPDSTHMQFDRPILKPYTTSLGTVTPEGQSSCTAYAYVTKAVHVGFCLVLGSRGGIMGNVNQPIAFYEPRPVDDFDSVWRYTWDIIAGYNIWEPNLFECHFVAVSLPKIGGIIEPPTLS
jgi:hypothetical protein